MAPSQNPLTLRFHTDALERDFLEDYARKSIRQVRYALVLGVLIYGAVFGVLDLVLIPPYAPVAWTVRLVVCALGGAVLLLTYSPLFARYMQPVLSGLLLVAGWGLILLLALEPSGENYYDGPVLIILPTFVAVRLRFVWASVVGWLIVAAFVIVAAAKGTPPAELAGSIIFISSANIIGMFAGYMLEDYARRDFWQVRLIDEKRRENEELLEMRSRFFANVSHELRTPLTLILGPLDDLLAGDDARLPGAVRKTLGVMRRNGRRLLRTINQLLDLAKLEAGGLRLQARQAPMAPLLRGIVASFSDHAERHGIDLQLDVEDEQVAPFFDAHQMEQVVVNLVANALNFTPEGGTVRVALAQQDDAAVVSVRDTGPGIRAEDLPHLFDRFHQADDSVLRRHPGTGIGLALARQIVELHGGRIDVESEPGFGSEFVVTLPLGRAHLRPADVADALPASPHEVHVPALDEPTADHAGESRPPEDASAAVLVVEDDPDVRAYVCEALADRFDVIQAENGREGLERAREAVPDLIVTDVMMPEMDGYAFCQALKSDRVLDHVPVIMLTAKSEPEHKIEGLEVGAEAYLTKPFSRRELRARVESLLANRRRLQRRFSSEVLVRPSPIDVDSADERFIQRAREAVEEEIGDEQFGVDALAEAVGMSRRQLQRKLKAVADQTPSTFIRLIRLGRAAQLIEQDYGTIAEIAYAVGFSSPSYFTKCFRETFGTTPTDYDGDTTAAEPK